MLKLQVHEKEVEIITSEEFVRGTVGKTCQIDLDEFWADYSNTIVFKRCNDKPINIIIGGLSNTITIPFEVMAESGVFRIGIFGVAEDKVLPTLWSDEIKVRYGTDTHGTEPAEYTPSEIDQLKSEKQDKLTAGDNITIDENNVISAIVPEISIDDELSDTSENAVQNKVITEALDEKQDFFADVIHSNSNDDVKLDLKDKNGNTAGQMIIGSEGRVTLNLNQGLNVDRVCGTEWWSSFPPDDSSKEYVYIALNARKGKPIVSFNTASGFPPKVSGVANPEYSDDAANKDYVDTGLSKKLDETSYILYTNKIAFIPPDASSSDVVTKIFLNMYGEPHIMIGSDENNPLISIPMSGSGSPLELYKDIQIGSIILRTSVDVNGVGTIKFGYSAMKVKLYNVETDTTDDSSVVNYGQLKNSIATQVSSVYKAKGSIPTIADLPTPSKDTEGFVYNIESEFTTNSNFVEGVGKTYPAGTNVVIVNTEGTTYKYDVLAGMVDLTAYATKTDLNNYYTKSQTYTKTEVDNKITSEIGNINSILATMFNDVEVTA